jgi:hypothetical protein
LRIIGAPLTLPLAGSVDAQHRGGGLMLRDSRDIIRRLERDGFVLVPLDR